MDQNILKTFKHYVTGKYRTLFGNTLHLDSLKGNIRNNPAANKLEQ
jgi:hypothetical protein